MKQVINAQFVIDGERDKKTLRDNIINALGYADVSIQFWFEGDKGYKDPLERLKTVDEGATVTLMLRAGMLWTCACSHGQYINPEDRMTCENCGEPKPQSKPVLKVLAEVHSDDHQFEANFDATPWFEQADDDDIENLANCGFGGDMPADEVAMFFQDKDPDVGKIFKYLELEPHMHGDSKQDRVGFECYVDAEDARAWIKQNRPELFKVIWKED